MSSAAPPGPAPPRAHQNQIVNSVGTSLSGNVVGSAATAILQGTQIISQGTQGGTVTTNPGTVRTLPAAVRLLPQINIPLQQHTHIAVATSRSQSSVGQPQMQAKQLTSYHVPRGPAAVASLSVPRATAAPRAPTPSTGWPSSNNQLRASAVVYTPRAARPHTLQVATTQRPATLRPTVPQAGTTTVVARAVRPANTPSPQRTPPPQVLQTVTPIRTAAPKVVPLVQRNYQPAKVVSVATLGVRSNISQITPRGVSGGYYYEVAGNINNTVQQTTASSNVIPTVPLSTLHTIPTNITQPVHSAINAFSNTGGNLIEISRPPSSPITIPQRPSILRKRENEGSPVKSQWSTAASPPPSPGGSTTESAASSGPELDNEELTMPTVTIPPPQIILPYNNCSPRKKPRKQLLISEVRGTRGSDCEFPSEGGRAPVAPSPPPAVIPPPAPPPPEAEKPPRRVMLGAGWKCGWRANALHFTRPTDVRRREERRPSVVELAAQKHVLQKANGWKVHHLTAQMEDLIELESGVLHQATEALRRLEEGNQLDLDRITELLKGNIQRSKIVCEGVEDVKMNVLRIFQHKTPVSDILARQADKRCFKKHRNQY